MVSSLDFKRGKDAELAWLDAQIVTRDVTRDAVRSSEAEEEEKLKLLNGDNSSFVCLQLFCLIFLKMSGIL